MAIHLLPKAADELDRVGHVHPFAQPAEPLGRRPQSPEDDRIVDDVDFQAVAG